MKKLLDTNLLIRFLLNDNPKQSAAVQSLFETTPDELVLTDVSVAEMIWLLTSYYQLPKDDVIDKVKQILTLGVINANKSVLSKALSLYQSINIDYIDAYLAAYCEEENLSSVISFDRDFDKIKSIQRTEP